jgi:hypothetical protein
VNQLIKSYPILKSKVDYLVWKRAISFFHFSSLPLFSCNDVFSNDEFELNLCKTIYDGNQKILLKMVEYQFNEKNEIFNPDIIPDLIFELRKVKSSERLTENDKVKVDGVIRNLDELYFSFISIDERLFYFPQVSMDKTYLRLYYHPLYSMKEKAILKLLKSGLIGEKFCVHKWDINGALIRTVLKLLGLTMNNQELIEISNTKEDIYKVVAERYNLLDEYNLNRNTFKKELIKSINKGKSQVIEKSEELQRLISNLHRIADVEIVRKYLTIYCLNKVILIQQNNDGFVFLFNLDGGFFVSKQKQLALPEDTPIIVEPVKFN